MVAASPIIGYLLIAIEIIFLIGGILCATALDTILLAALYIYPKEGVVPKAFAKAHSKVNVHLNSSGSNY